MKEFKEILATDLNENAFKIIGEDWMLIAAEKEGKTNAMTASWGGIGVIWNKPCAFIFIRQTRYTKEFVDAKERFTLNFFGGEFKKELGYFGKVSGRDEDKIQKTGLNVSLDLGVPVFEKAKVALICRKQFAQKLDENAFVDKSILEKFYSKDSMHTLYIAEIEKVLVRS